MEKTAIKFVGQSQYNEWEVGEKGYIDGYVNGGDGTPCAVVIKQDGTFVLAAPNTLKVDMITYVIKKV